MIVTELYKGQGLGNQLFCYAVTRVIAQDKGYDFGIGSSEKFKGHEFLSLDFGKPVIGGSGPEGGPPRTLPESTLYYYNERKLSHPSNGADIRTYDKDLVNVPDNTKIDGVMQDEQYLLHRRDEIRQWFAVKPEYDCTDYASDDICVINFRGGEYVYVEDLFLTKKYWADAVSHMLKINKHFRFVVITDDVVAAKKFFPKYEVCHFNIGKDYAVVKNAHYLILSNSSFAWFPAWLSTNLKYCIAPKYWARHNISDGFWSCSYNLTSGWNYLGKDGKLYSYEECRQELAGVIEANPQFFAQKKLTKNFLVVSNYYNDLSWVPQYATDYLVYDQGDTGIYPPHLDQSKVIKSEHLGHNIRDYCTYIIDHYDTLPERVLFATGNIFPRHISRERFNQLLNNEYFTPMEELFKHADNWPISFTSSDGGFCEKNTSWYLELQNAHPTKYFHNYNHFLEFCFKNPVIPRYVRFAPGANYIVPKQQILKYPKVFYANLRTFVSHCPTAIPGESHIIERAFHTIWTSNFELAEGMLRPIDSSFVARPAVVPTAVEKITGQATTTHRKARVAATKVVRKIRRIRQSFSR